MFDNQQVKVLILLKLHQLQREELSSLTYQNMVDYLIKKCWKEHFPESLSEIADQVLAVRAEEIVSFLSYQAIVEGKKNSLNDYKDLLQHD